jgi:hypothetical protein
MKKIVAVLAAAVILMSAAAPGALAGKRDGRHGGFHGRHFHGGQLFKHRPYYGFRYRHHYKHRPYTGHRYRHPYKYRPYYGHRYRRHGGVYGHFGFHGHGDAAVVVGALAGGLVLGHLLTRPPAPYAAPRVPRSPSGAPLGNCLQTTGTGSWYGRPAQFGGTMCYDRAGQAYIIGGSQRFLRYLD